MIRTLIIDGSFLAYSRFKASNLYHGFLRKVLGLRRTYQPGMVFIAWDTPQSADSRKEILPAYKADRPKKELDYYATLGLLRQALPMFGIHQAEGPGEGDDVIATLCQHRGPNLIWSADKDLLQLVSPTTSMVKAGVGKRPDTEVTIKNIEELTGLDPDEWRSVLALAGDRVDGVPGLKGVGEKTARAIVRACPHFVGLIIDGAFEQAREETAGDAKVGKYVERAIAEQAELKASAEVVQLHVIPLSITPAEPDWERAKVWLEHQGLEKLVELM